MIIQCYLNRLQLARLHSDGRLEMVSNHGATNVATMPIRGFYDHLNGIIVALYRAEAGLVLRANDHCIEINDDTHAALDAHGEHISLEIFQGDTCVAKVDYTRPKWNRPVPIELDPTPGIDIEHFDLGIFLANVLNRKDRQEVLLAVWK